jgi:hypothetical protein
MKVIARKITGRRHGFRRHPLQFNSVECAMPIGADA